MVIIDEINDNEKKELNNEENNILYPDHIFQDRKKENIPKLINILNNNKNNKKLIPKINQSILKLLKIYGYYYYDITLSTDLRVFVDLLPLHIENKEVWFSLCQVIDHLCKNNIKDYGWLFGEIDLCNHLLNGALIYSNDDMVLELIFKTYTSFLSIISNRRHFYYNNILQKLQSVFFLIPYKKPETNIALLNMFNILSNDPILRFHLKLFHLSIIQKIIKKYIHKDPYICIQSFSTFLIILQKIKIEPFNKNKDIRLFLNNLLFNEQINEDKISTLKSLYKIDGDIEKYKNNIINKNNYYYTNIYKDDIKINNINNFLNIDDELNLILNILPNELLYSEKIIISYLNEFILKNLDNLDNLKKLFETWKNLKLSNLFWNYWYELNGCETLLKILKLTKNSIQLNEYITLIIISSNLCNKAIYYFLKEEIFTFYLTSYDLINNNSIGLYLLINLIYLFPKKSRIILNNISFSKIFIDILKKDEIYNDIKLSQYLSCILRYYLIPLNNVEEKEWLLKKKVIELIFNKINNKFNLSLYCIDHLLAIKNIIRNSSNNLEKINGYEDIIYNFYNENYKIYNISYYMSSFIITIYKTIELNNNIHLNIIEKFNELKLYKLLISSLLYHYKNNNWNILPIILKSIEIIILKDSNLNLLLNIFDNNDNDDNNNNSNNINIYYIINNILNNNDIKQKNNILLNINDLLTIIILKNYNINELNNLNILNNLFNLIINNENYLIDYNLLIKTSITIGYCIKNNNQLNDKLLILEPCHKIIDLINKELSSNENNLNSIKKIFSYCHLIRNLSINNHYRNILNDLNIFEIIINIIKIYYNISEIINEIGIIILNLTYNNIKNQQKLRELNIHKILLLINNNVKFNNNINIINDYELPKYDYIDLEENEIDDSEILDLDDDNILEEKNN